MNVSTIDSLESVRVSIIDSLTCCKCIENWIKRMCYDKTNHKKL